MMLLRIKGVAIDGNGHQQAVNVDIDVDATMVREDGTVAATLLDDRASFVAKPQGTFDPRGPITPRMKAVQEDTREKMLTEKTRPLLVFDGKLWFLRRVRTIEHDLVHDEKVYRCDASLGGPYAKLEDAAKALELLTRGGG